MNMTNQIGGALTAIVTPWFGDIFGWSTGFRVAATVAALGAVAWLFVNPRANLTSSSAAGIVPATFSEQKDTA
jgi:ACS family glucarate transporter-like MFS transporter